MPDRPARAGTGSGLRAIVKEARSMNVIDEEDPGRPLCSIELSGLREGLSLWAWTSQAGALPSRDYLNQYCRRRE